MTQTDTIVIILYLAITLLIGLLASRKNRKTDSTEFFLASRSLGWFAIGVSIFATNISSEHFIGLAGSGANRGLAAANFELFAIPFLLLVGWVLAPIFIKSKVFTVPEFLGNRFNPAIQLTISGLSIVIYLFTKIFLSLYASGILFHEFLGWDVYRSGMVLIAITGLYTIIGGMRAVVHTAIFQGILLIVGALLVTFYSLDAIGGISRLPSHLPESYFSIFLPLDDPDFPWAGMVFGAPILAIWYWCADQYILQHVLAAKDVCAARSGTLLTGFLKLLPMFILILPGMVAVALFPGINGDNALPNLFTGSLLPVGIKGLALAGVLAALMSSLSAAFISSSTLFTMDFYRHFNPKANSEKLALVGRLATMFIVFLAVLWAPLMRLIDTRVYVHLQSFQAYVAPPIAAIVIMAIFGKSLTVRGALYALLTGELLGFARLISEINNWAATFAFHPLIEQLLTMNFLYYAIFLFLITIATGWCVSFLQHSAYTGVMSRYMVRPANILGIIKRSPKQAGTLDTGSFFDLAVTGTLIIVLIGIWGILQ